MSPFHTTGWKCFAENWACTTFPREIDWDSESIGHECGVVVSLGWVGWPSFWYGVSVSGASVLDTLGDPGWSLGLGVLLSLGSSGFLGGEHFVFSYKKTLCKFNYKFVN